ncbi:hypothetical protein [uncultured Fluviicola sp.]|uniref:hypothetical protein n=1 Tax=uncultured Fluviicola sp. TaxID=463303 RepID=UPI0026003BE8|nr:hypothetical protein [uncultured Fluviicola sp.]
MKYLVLIFIISSVFASFGQDTLQNFSPNRAWVMCSDPSTKLYSSSNGFICNNGYTKQYFLFKPENNYAASTISFRGYANAGTGTPVTISYKLYGPFNANDDYASLVENNVVAPVSVGGPSAALIAMTAALTANKHYLLEITSQSCTGRVAFDLRGYSLGCSVGKLNVECENCIPKFQPMNGKYVVTGWVKEQGGEAKTSYDKCVMKVIIGAAPPVTIPVSGQIIDGWQRMEETVTANSTGEFAIELSSLTSNECYFDDIRVIPYESSMVSYVYDPVTMRLIAELDERNYAKIYEYDDEGRLVRVKKETERGVMTIQENKENTSVKDGY